MGGATPWNKQELTVVPSWPARIRYTRIKRALPARTGLRNCITDLQNHTMRKHVQQEQPTPPQPGKRRLRRLSHTTKTKLTGLHWTSQEFTLWALMGRALMGRALTRPPGPGISRRSVRPRPDPCGVLTVIFVI